MLLIDSNTFNNLDLLDENNKLKESFLVKELTTLEKKVENVTDLFTTNSVLDQFDTPFDYKLDNFQINHIQLELEVIENENKESLKVEESFISDEQELKDFIAIEKKQSISKKKQPFKKKNISYAERVNRWFNVEKTRIWNDGTFPEYKNETLSTRNKAIDNHAFSKSVDCFLDIYAYEKTFINQSNGQSEKSYIIAGEMKTNGVNFKGIFTYTFDSRNVVYHRYFSLITKDHKALYDHVMKILFSKVAQPKNHEEIEHIPSLYKDENITRHKDSGKVKIENTNGTRLIIYPTKF